MFSMKVYEATSECVLSKENCLGIRPFIAGREECKSMCQNHRQCGYYKYVAEGSPTILITIDKGIELK